ncbi:MAG: hypothetical protein CFE21_04820 [Bacteroidetes bacterium B1(2017)]|nr:MAG: hypothetical protein CFE21_04820 [Bacteroidetes bacterium B1(2017)]
MYLIFLILSVIQIPIAWLKVSPVIHTYLKKPHAVYSDSILVILSNKLDQTDSLFKKELGYDEQKDQMPEPNSFTITDRFFMDGTQGKNLFDDLVALRNWAQQLPATDERKAFFTTLFDDDLKNGIGGKEDVKKWLQYRWKHVPAGLARNLLEELNLRYKLLGNKKGITETPSEEPKFTLMTGYSTMRVGDAANLATRGDKLVELFVDRDGVSSMDYEINGNSFNFKPSVAGMYTLKAKGLIKTETMVVQVLPAGFPQKEALPFRVCYTGVTYTQKIPLYDQGARLTCEADPEATIETKTGKLSFNPKKEGWCTIRINTGEGILFLDSVFVKPLPDPIFELKNLPSLSISKSRLEREGKIELQAIHPSFEEGVFEIKSFDVRWVGSNSQVEKINGTQLKTAGKSMAQLQYIIIYNIEVRAGNESRKFEKPIIIQLI